MKWFPSSRDPSQGPTQVKRAASAARTITAPSSSPLGTPAPAAAAEYALPVPVPEPDESTKSLATASRCALEKLRKGMPNGFNGERRYASEIGGACVVRSYQDQDQGERRWVPVPVPVSVAGFYFGQIENVRKKM